MKKPANILVPALLFLLLSPGMLVTLPPGPSGKLFFSGETSKASVFVHTLLFAALYCVLRTKFATFY